MWTLLHKQEKHQHTDDGNHATTQSLQAFG